MPPITEQRPGSTDRTPLFTLLTANALSQVGNAGTGLAVPWFILQTTGSAAKTGLAAAAIGIGSVLPPIVGGPLVDELGFKRTSVLGDVTSGAAVVAVPLLYGAGVLTFWQLLVLVFLLSSFNAQGQSARLALIPALAGRAAMAIERANAADRAVARLGEFLGPLLVGVLIAVIGPAKVLFIDAATFALSAALIAPIVPAAGSAATDADTGGKAGYLTELLEGLRFVWSNRLVLSIVLLAMVTNALDVPLVQVVLPVYARAFYGSATVLGAMLGAYAGGALVGTVLFGIVAQRLPRRIAFLSSFIVAPLVIYVALATRSPLPVILAAGVVGGAISGPINPLYETVIQETTPPQMLGRVFGAVRALAGAGVPVGAVLVGVAAQGAGLISTIFGMGAIYLAVTLGMVLNPALRQMDTGSRPAEG